MQIKSPVCYDISHHKEIPQFSLIDPKPSLLITKATEDVGFVDPKFYRYFSGAMEVGCIRGAYHFFRKRFDAVRQAQHFLDTLSKIDILKTDFLILDVEEGGEKASQLWAWFEHVRKFLPENRIMLYSAKRILDPIIMTYSEREYFKQIPVWVAGYPYFPDTFSKVPIGYIPDQTKWGKVSLWQYTSHGRVDGIETELGKPTDVDLNWIEPEFYKSLGDNTMAEEAVSFTGKCVNIDNKVWSSIGGRAIGSVKPISAGVSGDKRATVAGVLYIHLTSPIVGWTKKQWFDVTFQTTPPPVDPPQEPPAKTVTHTIDIFSDGSINVDGQPH